MMVNPNKERLNILFKIDPWLIVGSKDDEPPTLKPNAPDNIKKLYEKWLKMI